MEQAIVTGGLGFIGSHLVERLLAEGLAVIVIDNLATGRRSNLESVHTHPHLKVIESDILEPKSFADHCQKASYLFHLAALADVVPSIERPSEYFASNVAGTLRVLEFARSHPMKKISYAASSSCYGIPNQYPTPENYPADPQYPYALTKYLGEQMVLHWGKVYHLPVISLRLFNVYGPRQRTTGSYGAVFGTFLAQKRASQPLTIVGDGTQSRDFIHVRDVVEGMILAANSNFSNEIFNVGAGQTYPINELAKLIGGKTVHVPKRPGEPDCTHADIRKINKLLGWQPKIKFSDGVAEMLKDLTPWASAPVWTPSSIQKATKTWFRYLGKEAP